MGTTPDQTPSVASDKVSWGPSTYAGYGVSAVAFVLALTAFLGGDRSEQVIGVLVPGVIGGLSFAITQIGRYAQAKAKIDVTKAVVLAQGGLAELAAVPPQDIVDTLERMAAAVDRIRQPSALSREEWTGGGSPVRGAAAAVAAAPGGQQQ